MNVIAGTKFHFKQKIWFLGPNLPQKEYFQLKAEKVNITIDFWILELPYSDKFLARM